MSKRAPNVLSPVQKKVRNALVYFLFRAGFNVKFIAGVMNMTESTTSRVTRRTDSISLSELTGLEE